MDPRRAKLKRYPFQCGVRALGLGGKCKPHMYKYKGSGLISYRNSDSYEGSVLMRRAVGVAKKEYKKSKKESTRYSGFPGGPTLVLTELDDS